MSQGCRGTLSMSPSYLLISPSSTMSHPSFPLIPLVPPCRAPRDGRVVCAAPRARLHGGPRADRTGQDGEEVGSGHTCHTCPWHMPHMPTAHATQKVRKCSSTCHTAQEELGAGCSRGTASGGRIRRPHQEAVSGGRIRRPLSSGIALAGNRLQC